MDSRGLSTQNRTAGCGNPGVVSGNGGPTSPNTSGDRNQGLNAAGSSSAGRRGTSSFPPIFSASEPRPLQTDFFRHVALFYAHLGPEEESEQWANFLPEYLRPGNMEKYLEETDKPELYGNNYWWLSQKNSAQEQPSFNQSDDHIRYSRDQLLELREVVVVPENILKIKQEIEAEYLGVNQITRRRGTNVDMRGARRERRSALKKKKEEKKVATIPLNSMKEAPQIGEKEKHEVATIPLNSTKKAPQTGGKEKHEVANISVNPTKEAPQIGEKEKHEVANILVNSTKKAPQTGEKEKHEVANISVNPMKVAPQRGEKERHGVANISVNSMKEAPQAGEKEKREVANVCVNSMKEAPQTGEKEKHEVANISVNPMQEEPQTGEKEKQEGFVSESKKEKKRRRVITNERKEKKKIVKKKKRAEKNRKLGVRRLKIQPLLKPKPVSHCRHYLKGRCHEGENCKFSHDVEPLTKSSPCCHFARQSCMKGDDCPYDHDLSKYPCDKYVSTGFCPRQENCLFSHKATPNQDPASTAGTSKPETKASNPPPVSDSIRHQNRAALGFGATNKPVQEPKGSGFLSLGKANVYRKPHFAFGAGNKQADISLVHNGSGSVTAGNPKDNGPASKADQPMKTPKGLTFLNFGNSQKDEKSVRTSNSADVYEFGKNSLPDHNKKNQPSLPTFGNSNKIAFGADKKDAAVPSNPPASPNSAEVFVFGKNSPHDQNKKNQPSLLAHGNSDKTAFGGDEKDAAVPSNPPASSNPVGVFVFGKNPLHDHNKKNQPSLLPFGNKSVFGADKNDAAAPSNPPASPIPPSSFSARLNAIMKNTSSSGQRSSLSTLAFGSSPVTGSEANRSRGTGPVSGSEPIESRVSANASVGANSASADASKNGGASLKKPLSAAEVWEMLYGKGSGK